MTVLSHIYGTPYTLICTTSAMEQGDLEPGRAGSKIPGQKVGQCSPAQGEGVYSA